jgi:CRP-like cAMP-binding protein
MPGRRETFRVGGRRAKLLVNDNKEGAEKLARFREAIKITPNAREESDVALIHEWFQDNFASLVRDLNETMVRVLTSGVQYERFTEGEVVYKEGDVGDKFYMILAGAVAVWVKDVGEVNRIGAGQYFGEVALIHGSNRAATVAATYDRSSVECAVVGGKIFNESLLWSLKIDHDVFKSKEYQEIISQNVNQQKRAPHGARRVSISQMTEQIGGHMVMKRKRNLVKLFRKLFHAVYYLIALDKMVFESHGYHPWRYSSTRSIYIARILLIHV